MVVVGIFFIRRQLSLPYRCYRLIYCVSRCFRFLFALCLLFLRTNAGNDFPALLPATVLGRSEVETGLLLTPWPLAQW